MGKALKRLQCRPTHAAPNRRFMRTDNSPQCGRAQRDSRLTCSLMWSPQVLSTDAHRTAPATNGDLRHLSRCSKFSARTWVKSRALTPLGFNSANLQCTQLIAVSLLSHAADTAGHSRVWLHHMRSPAAARVSAGCPCPMALLVSAQCCAVPPCQ